MRRRSAGARISRDYLGARNRHHEAAAPFADMAHLRDHLVLDVPRQDQHVVGPGIADMLGGENRDVRSGQELALLVRAAVDRVLQLARAQPAVVEQRIAFGWRAVTDHALALAPGTFDELEQRAPGLCHLRGEAPIALDAVEAGGSLI